MSKLLSQCPDGAENAELHLAGQVSHGGGELAGQGICRMGQHIHQQGVCGHVECVCNGNESVQPRCLGAPFDGAEVLRCAADDGCQFFLGHAGVAAGVLDPPADGMVSHSVCLRETCRILVYVGTGQNGDKKF